MNKETPQALVVKEATYADIDDMVAICEENLVATNREKFSAADFSGRGFLIHKLTYEDAKKMIDDKKNFLVLVLKNGEKTLAYLTGCDISQTPETFQEAAKEIKKLRAASGKIFYHRQIAKKSSAKKVGENLVLAMLQEAAKRAYLQVVCKIIHAPFLNEKSIAFHKKFGFEQVGSIEENGLLAGIYLKVL